MIKQTYSELTDYCFCCGRKLGMFPVLVDTRDAQTAFIGRRCWKKVRDAGDDGYQPVRGGPKLYPLPGYQRKTNVKEPRK